MRDLIFQVPSGAAPCSVKKPYDDDEGTSAVAEEVVEDDWGSVWEEVVE